jgi:hypothetical protein
MIEPLSKRVNDLGWHIQIHMKGEQIAGMPVARAYVKAAPQRMVWALLLVSTLPAGAQQPQPPTTTTGCFKVEMSHSTQGNPQGSILLDRCTGKTWLLLCIRNDTAGCAFQWAPIPDANEPAAAGKSEQCTWEVDRTIELSKRLLPVVFKSVPDHDTPRSSGACNSSASRS